MDELLGEVRFLTGDTLGDGGLFTQPARFPYFRLFSVQLLRDAQLGPRPRSLFFSEHRSRKSFAPAVDGRTQFAVISLGAPPCRITPVRPVISRVTFARRLGVPRQRSTTRTCRRPWTSAPV